MMTQVPPDSAIDLKEVLFDPDFYHNKYPDLQNAFHHDNARLRQHWVNHGIKEGRACSEVLDLKFYVNSNPDLLKAFGTDYPRAYEHFFRHGIKEMRQSSPTYNPKIYKANCPILANLTPCQLMWHFRHFGRPQGMHAGPATPPMPVGPVTPTAPPMPVGPPPPLYGGPSMPPPPPMYGGPSMPPPPPMYGGPARPVMQAAPPDSSIDIKEVIFDPDFYHNKYPDLQNAFHHDSARLRQHWYEFGIKEGRACSEVLDLTFYLNNNPDLKRTFGTDYTRAYEHFLRHGINEMRQSSPTFNPKYYRANYSFLANLTPSQLIWQVRNMGRTAAPPVPSVPPMAPSLDLKELIMDPDFYYRKYPDLQDALHHDNAKLRQHWRDYGIKEGRACSEALDLKFYVNYYPDLQQAFGNDYARAYEHFFRHGINEMRQSSPTYNPKAYQLQYNLYNLSPQELLHHYMVHGRTRLDGVNDCCLL